MNLYIEIENGQPKNHPAFEDNLMQAFGVIPANWEPFVRVEQPVLGVYELINFDVPPYAKVNDVWTDVWTIRDMTAEEKLVKQQDTKNVFNSREQAENWSAWTLDETTCVMAPPISRPAPIEGAQVDWCGAENNWKEVPTRPTNNGQYKFDFLVWQWVQDVN
jgi:hypothetical protein